MKERTIDILMHPLKGRLMLEIWRRGEVTTRELGKVCADIPQATLYRHVRGLLDAGVIVVVREQKVRSVKEKVYAVSESFRQENAYTQEQTMTGDQFLALIAHGMANLMEQFSVYRGRENIDLSGDYVSFRVAGFYASDAEMEQIFMQLGQIINQVTSNDYAPGRKLRNLATISTPPRMGKCGSPQEDGHGPQGPAK